MSQSTKTLIDLEKRFWQAMVDQDAESAMKLLGEPALMVSAHGALKFDREGYRRMAERGPMIVKSFELSDMDVVFPDDTTAILTYRVKQAVTPRGRNEPVVQEMNDSSTWVKNGQGWQCVMHTETPVAATKA